MQAIVHDTYGSPDVLEVRQVDRPVAAGDRVLVRVHAAAVNPLDWHYVRGKPYLVRAQAGLRGPKRGIRGVDMAGTVEAVGDDVTELRPGDEVFGEVAGAFAEYVSARESSLAPKPANVSFEEAAAVPVAGLTALQGLRDKAGLEPGQRVLVNGASGGVGTYAVQIAKALGAEVTGVCSTRNVDLVRAIGADDVVDYTQEDFTRRGRRYDVMLDMVGTHPLRNYRRALSPDGAYVSVGALDMGDWVGPLVHVLRVAVASRLGSQRMTVMLARANKADLEALGDLMEGGKVRSVIDRRYPLSEAPEAIRYVEEGHARGKVVITV